MRIAAGIGAAVKLKVVIGEGNRVRRMIAAGIGAAVKLKVTMALLSGICLLIAAGIGAAVKLKVNSTTRIHRKQLQLQPGSVLLSN